MNDQTPTRGSPSRTRTSSEIEIGQGPPRQIIVGRPANACLRCRRRKVKCPCEQPACVPCAKAKVVCEYPTKKPSAPNWQYVHHLEAKLRTVEQRADSVSSTSPIALTEHPFTQPISPTPGPSTLNLGPLGPLSKSTMQHQRMAPPSSAQLFDRLPSVADLDVIRLDAHAEHDEEFIPAKVDADHLPAREELDQAVDYFATQVNSAFPILHEPSLRRQTANLYSGNETSSQVDVFIAFTLLAIWCASMARLRSPREEWFKRSQSNGEAARSSLTLSVMRPSLVKLQCQHLWLQYVLRNPEAGDIWGLTGDVVRSTFDLGLHLDGEGSARQNHQPLELDMRRRLFWASFCLDHKVAVALGRPPGIVSDWISARFPSLAEDDEIESGSSPTTPSHIKESVIHHIRLRILQADIYQRLFTVAASRIAPPASEWFIMMGNKLEEWRSSYHSQPGELLEPHWLDLHYNLSRQLLYRPNPGNPNPDQQSLLRALEASSYLMRRYKAMWRQRTINFVWLAIHHVFVSGVTYLNAIWIAAKNGWTIVPSLVEAMLDIQACSQVLEGMTETQHGTSHMRDAFEVVSAAVVRHLSSRSPNGGFGQFNQEVASHSGPSLDQTQTHTQTQAMSLAPDAQLNHLLSSDMHSFPWSTWAIDPSRPPSPVTDESLATLDAFFFNPFNAVPPADILSMPRGDNDQFFGQMDF